MEGRYDRSRIGIPSSGDPAKDAAEIADIVRSRALMDEGLCPNGCGPRSPGEEPNQGTDAPGSHCPVCGFSTNVGVPRGLNGGEL